MNWILEHLQLVIVVASAIAYWLNQRRKAHQEQQELHPEGQPARTHMDSTEQVEQDERTRRIQEEIRRKILERLGGDVRPQLPQPPPLIERPVVRETVPVRVEVDDDLDASETEAQANEDRAVLERQQQLAERLRELNDKRREYAGREEEYALQTAVVPSLASSRGSLLAELRSPASARRAILLREVLGPPVGLR